MTEIENLKIGNGGTLHIVGNEDVVANAWQAGKTYVKNKSYVIREHRLYVCNVTHTSVEPFDATKWTEITIGDAIGNNIGDLSSLSTTVKSSLVGAVNSLVLAVETFSTSFSLNDNSFASVDFTITKSGYTPIAVGTISSSGYTEICTYYFRNNNNGCRVNLGNHTGANISSGTLTITVIYTKS